MPAFLPAPRLAAALSRMALVGAGAAEKQQPHQEHTNDTSVVAVCKPEKEKSTFYGRTHRQRLHERQSRQWKSVWKGLLGNKGKKEDTTFPVSQQDMTIIGSTTTSLDENDDNNDNDTKHMQFVSPNGRKRRTRLTRSILLLRRRNKTSSSTPMANRTLDSENEENSEGDKEEEEVLEDKDTVGRESILLDDMDTVVKETILRLRSSNKTTSSSPVTKRQLDTEKEEIRDGNDDGGDDDEVKDMEYFGRDRNDARMPIPREVSFSTMQKQDHDDEDDDEEYWETLEGDKFTYEECWETLEKPQQQQQQDGVATDDDDDDDVDDDDDIDRSLATSLSAHYKRAQEYVSCGCLTEALAELEQVLWFQDGEEDNTISTSGTNSGSTCMTRHLQLIKQAETLQAQILMRQGRIRECLAALLQSY